MKKEFKEKLPMWYKDITPFELCLTDDIDSLLSCTFLNEKFWSDIKMFYSFSKMYKQSNLTEKIKIVGVDLDLSEGRCFGNHVTYVENPLSINLNNVISDKRYFRKYPCSTILLILSLYEYDIFALSDEQLRVLLAIDSSYKGYCNESFQWVQVEWFDNLGYKDKFIEILDKTTPQDFKKINYKYGLSKKIEIIDGKLYTEIELEALSKLFDVEISLPKFKFDLIKEFKNIGIPLEEASKIETDKIFSSAITRKSFVNISLKQ
jgi:hypothetical protein